MIKLTRASLILLAAAVLAASAPHRAEARAAASHEIGMTASSLPGVMREGRRHEGPPAHAAFCARRPEICAPASDARPGAVGALSPEARAQLFVFNADVNSAFAPAEDLALYGRSDFWTLPSTHADCEDYVLYKRARLIDAGWPPEAALIAVVKSPTQGYHAVLVLRTADGELVLDNLRDEILDWRDTGYEWVIRQSAADPSQWVEIQAPGAQDHAPRRSLRKISDAR